MSSKKALTESLIQSVLVDKDMYTKKQAVSILRKSGASNIIDETKNYYRARQLDPILFDRNTFRTWHISSGIKAVVGRVRR